MAVTGNLLRSGKFKFKPCLEALEARQLLAATLPVLPAILAPTSNPALPSGFDTFSPQGLTGSTPAGAPGIAQWTQSAGPNQTIAVSLTNPGSSTQFLTYGQTSASNGALVTDTIDQMGGGIASVNLGSGNTANSMYLLWAENASGISSAVAINKTTAWWVGPDQASPGQTVSVYGQNLTFSPTDGLSWVYITQAGSSTGRWATVSAANPYQVSFVVPTGLASGNYQVWVHNGHGGEYGWSSPVTLSVGAAAVTFNGPVFNVTSYGAVGNGTTDDTAAFVAAMNAAVKDPGSTVYVPTGNYLVSQFQIQTGVQLLGDGAGKTVILENPSVGTVPTPSMILLQSNIQVENLTLDSNNVALADVVFGRSLSNIHFVNVTFNGHLTQDMDIHADQLVFLQNCNLTGDGNFLGTASQLFIDGCNFYGTNDANVLLYSWGGSDISITNCTVQDLNNSNVNSGAGWAKGRFFDGADLWGSQTDTYIASNTTIALGVRPACTDQNSGEQLLWEGQPLVTGGRYVSAAAGTVTYTGLPSSVGAGYYAIVVAGDGVGECVPISSYNATTGIITLAGSWAALPDATSVIRVGYVFENVVVYDNTLQGKGAAKTASCGVQFFGGAINCVVDSNHISNVTDAITATAMPSYGSTIPLYFNVFQNNTITNSGYGFDIWADGTGDQVGNVGNVVRANQVNNVSVIALLLRDVNTTGAPFYLIVEDNTATNVPIGLALQNCGTATTDLTLTGNTFTLGSAPATASIAIDIAQSVVLVETADTTTGFAQTIGGSVAPTMAEPVVPAPGTQSLLTNSLDGSGSSSSGSSGTSGSTGTTSGGSFSSGSGSRLSSGTPKRHKKTSTTTTTAAQTITFAAVTMTTSPTLLQTNQRTVTGIDATILN